MSKGDKVMTYISGKEFKAGIFVEEDNIQGKVPAYRVQIGDEIYCFPKSDVKRLDSLTV